MDGAAGPAGTREVVADLVRLGRDASGELAVDGAAYPKVSGLHARIEAAGLGFLLVHESHSNKTLLNGKPVDTSSAVGVGDRVQLGYTGPSFEILELEAAHSPQDFGASVQADGAQLALPRGSAQVDRFEVGTGGVIGRDAASAQFVLDHPHVSRLHASLAVDGARVVLADLGSANGTYVNGRRIRTPVTLNLKDRVEIGPYALRFDGTALVGSSRSNNVELAAQWLRRVVTDRTTGGPLNLLEDVNLVVRSREFVCILGPSGSGKSTLLAILSGRNQPNGGEVALNGEDLYANFEALKEDIAVVPQRDVLYEPLRLADALRYTAELRLPSDTSRDEIAASVTEILDTVGLTRRRGTLIRDLSGGQIKRASLANELIARPSLLFLDEVTSGLDEQTDREVMRLFRQVAEAGKTVVCITHNLASVEVTCHLVAVLTEGGRLAFYGTPEEAKRYFGNIPRLGDIYDRLAEKTPEEWHWQFRRSLEYRRYVVERLPKDRERDEDKDDSSTGREEGPRRKGLRVAIRQMGVLTRRYVAIWRGDTPALLALVGQGLLVAILLGIVFGNLDDAGPLRTRNLLLLLAVSCYWFGCNTAAKELVKERAIYGRERDFNLRVGPYLGSKLIVLALIATVQATVLFAIVRAWCRPPGPIVPQWFALATLAVAGVSAGLVVSALARTEETATALVPMVVIPQIILSGVIADLGDGLARWLANGLVAVRWGQEALDRLSPSSADTSDWWTPWSIVVAHAVVAAAITAVVLARSSSRRARS
jgi:ABC-type multidrug transport system ATPase subunit